MKQITLVAMGILMILCTHAQEKQFMVYPHCLHQTENIPYLPTDSRQKAYSPGSVDGLGEYGKSNRGIIPSVGKVRIPVLMVAFANKGFQKSTTREKVQRMFMESGYSDEATYGSKGSVHDYLFENSGGMFDPQFVVMDSIVLTKNIADYKNSSMTLVNDAIAKSLANGTDYSEFADNGLKAPNIVVYFAGFGQHNSPKDVTDYASLQWPHFRSSTHKAGPVTFQSYLMCNEARYWGSNTSANVVFDGIGVILHELMHGLGLADEYQTGNLVWNTPDVWSVMDYGEYYANGMAPIGLTAYQKNQLGWLETLNECLEEGRVVLEAGESALVRNLEDEKEYYFLENRQADGKWYPVNMGSGMLVNHIHFDATAWNNNAVNNTMSHLRNTMLYANGTYLGIVQKTPMSDMVKTLFGNEGVSSEISSGSDFNQWQCYTGTMDEQPVRDIKHKDGVVNFVYIKETTPTNIDRITESEHGRTFSLTGQSVRSNFRGIVIRDGRKMVVK